MCLRLLLIDDESFVTREITAALDGQGFVIREEQDAGRALETIRGFRPDVVLLDFLMPKLHGGDVAWQIASDPALKGGAHHPLQRNSRRGAASQDASTPNCDS